MEKPCQEIDQSCYENLYISEWCLEEKLRQKSIVASTLAPCPTMQTQQLGCYNNKEK